MDQTVNCRTHTGAFVTNILSDIIGVDSGIGAIIST
jgi:hypothetical protein